MGQAQSVATDHTEKKPRWFGNAFRQPLQLAASDGETVAAGSVQIDSSGLAAEPAVDAPAEPSVDASVDMVLEASVETALSLPPNHEIFASHHDKEALLGHIRHSIATLRTSELRVNDLRAGLGAVTERAKKEIAAANARADAAELRAASEAARANTAEQRWRESEARFGEILQVIASELDAPI